MIKMQKYKMVFKIEKEKKYLRILGKEFAKTNNNKGYLIIENQKLNLKDKDKILISNIKSEKIQIKMILKANLYNKSYMFKDCKNLLTLHVDDIDETDNIKYLINYDNNSLPFDDEENQSNYINNSAISYYQSQITL